MGRRSVGKLNNQQRLVKQGPRHHQNRQTNTFTSGTLLAGTKHLS